jgi:ankyrin repeat protein
LTGVCRDTWRCVPPGLSAADADRVRAEHPIWRAVIDLPGCTGWTRLAWAADRGKVTRVRSLCDWHAGLEVKEPGGWTALHFATYNGRTDCARELIARGADVNTASRDGKTPLMYASMFGFIDIVRLLLAAGADKRRVDSYGQIAHNVVDYRRNPEAIRALLDAAP